MLGPAELDPLLVPVALCPDTLLMPVLVAATYPLEVVEAERFVRASPQREGQALTRAAGNRDRDPSVVALLQFPSVLAMMSEKLDWTQQLGDAFQAQQADVMQTVRALRLRAIAAGNLTDTPQQHVVMQERIVVIEPSQPQVVYLPCYNPTIVYGNWWHPRPPWVWVPPPYYRPPNMGDVIAAGIFWGLAVAITNNIWNDYRLDWRTQQIHVHHHIHVHPSRLRPQPRLAVLPSARPAVARPTPEPRLSVTRRAPRPENTRPTLPRETARPTSPAPARSCRTTSTPPRR